MADRCDHGVAITAECSQCAHDQKVLVRQIALQMGRGNADDGLKKLAKIVSDSIARERVQRKADMQTGVPTKLDHCGVTADVYHRFLVWLADREKLAGRTVTRDVAQMYEPPIESWNLDDRGFWPECSVACAVLVSNDQCLHSCPITDDDRKRGWHREKCGVDVDLLSEWVASIPSQPGTGASSAPPVDPK